MLPKTQEELYQRWFSEPMVNCYQFQRHWATRLPAPLLNAASGPDPGRLAELGATNLDVQVIEPWSGNDHSKAGNFVHGSVLAMPFADASYGTVVLGEFLEHCTYAAAIKALAEVSRVLRPSGHLVMTVPLDARPEVEQGGYGLKREEPQPSEYAVEITTYHQTFWHNRLLDDLERESGFIERTRAPMLYALTCLVGGWGLVWQKKA